MIQLRDLEKQLKKISANYRFFGRPEIRELAKIMSPDEVVAQATNGYYENGFAFLAVTNHRLLLIDRKPMFLTLEDIRFDMVSEVDFNHRLLNAMIRVYTPNKSLVFSTWNHARLRQLANYLQDQVMHSRHQPSYVSHEQFAKYAQAQVDQSQQSQPAGGGNGGGSGSVLPALAQTAMQGANSANTPSSYMTHRFVAPLSRNPYVKTPLMTRHRRFPGV